MWLPVHISGSNFPIRSGRKIQRRATCSKQHEGKESQVDFERETHPCGPWAERHQGRILFLKGGYLARDGEFNSVKCVSCVEERFVKKNNILFFNDAIPCTVKGSNRNTLELQKLSPAPSPGLEIQNNQMDCWRWEDGEEWKHVNVY